MDRVGGRKRVWVFEWVHFLYSQDAGDDGSDAQRLRGCVLASGMLDIAAGLGDASRATDYRKVYFIIRLWRTFLQRSTTIFAGSAKFSAYPPHFHVFASRCG